MARQPNPYRRLPGTGSGAFETVRLYQAADHLLQVSSSGYTETYRRFYFRDIQAITVHRTRVGMIWNLVLSVVTVPSLLFTTALLIRLEAGDLGAGIFWGITAVVAGVPLLINTVRGPTSRCQIRTAVQTRPLPSLGRLRRAVKIIAQLRPHLEAAQGSLPAGEIIRRIDDARRGPVAVSATPVASAPDPPMV